MTTKSTEKHFIFLKGAIYKNRPAVKFKIKTNRGRISREKLLVEAAVSKLAWLAAHLLVQNRDLGPVGECCCLRY